MPPFNLMSASLLAKSFSVFSCSSSFARCTGVLPVSFSITRCLSAQAGGPPKRPLNGYMRYLLEQKPTVIQQHPDLKNSEVVKKIAQQWRTLSVEQKRPFVEAFQRAFALFKPDLERYQAQLSPAECEQQAADRKRRLAKRKGIIRKRELNSLGRPKFPRSSFNIFISEHFVEAHGLTQKEKMVSMSENWRNLPSDKKQVYAQLAQDDKIRFKNEMKAWEEHMVEIGRTDLIQTRTRRNPAPAATKQAPKKEAKAGKGKTAGKKTAATGSSAASKRR